MGRGLLILVDAGGPNTTGGGCISGVGGGFVLPLCLLLVYSLLATRRR